MKVLFIMVAIYFSITGYASEIIDYEQEYDYVEEQREFESENINIYEQVKKVNALSCFCTGGPGMYKHSCAPVEKQCSGGPGGYPYKCYVCPQG